MKPLPWEVSLLDWTAVGREGARVSPSAVLRLLEARTENEALQAYYELDGVVCLSGMTYAAALPTTQMILAHLVGTNLAARARCLELLTQVCSGVDSDDAPGYVLRCLEELHQSAWFLLHELQTGEPENMWHYVDLVGLLGMAFPPFCGRAKAYLELAGDRAATPGEAKLIASTLADLRTSHR
jgi:hypothetical protein